jgi:hypothetical protein
MQDKRRTEPPQSSDRNEADAKKRRLADALRDNLKRRKAQARARSESADAVAQDKKDN